jgi:hypothetical protein
VFLFASAYKRPFRHAFELANVKEWAQPLNKSEKSGGKSHFLRSQPKAKTATTMIASTPNTTVTDISNMAKLVII